MLRFLQTDNISVTFRLGIILATGFLATVFWDSLLLLPIKLLVVLVHEIWHGLLALVFQARVENIDLSWQESGETVITALESQAGFILTASAGYIGSVFTGTLLLRMGLSEDFPRTTLWIFSGLLFYMSYLFAGSLSLAFYTGLLWALVIFCITLLGRHLSTLTLLVLGTLFIWYSIYDLYDFTRELNNTDAGILAAYAKAQGWTEMSQKATARTISLIWTIIIPFILYFFLKGIVNSGIVSSTTVSNHKAQPENTQPEGQPLDISAEKALSSDVNRLQTTEFDGFDAENIETAMAGGEDKMIERKNA